MQFSRRLESYRLPWWVRILTCVCLAFLAGVLILYFRQHSMLYHPRPYDESYADALPRDAFEIEFATLSGKQTAFYLPRGSGERLPKRVWIAFCGNGSLALDWTWLVAQDRPASAPSRTGSSLRRGEQPGDAFLLIDYPGYGKSEGYATIAATRAVADHAVKELAARLLVTEEDIERRLNVIGHSWGSAVALDFATHHPVQRIVLVSAFTTLREEAAIIVGGMLSHLLIENYDNRAALRELAKASPPPKIDIFHGTNDEVIPFHMGRDLAQEFPALIKFHPVEGADHITVLNKAAGQIIAAMNAPL
jgi:uncharacterized protein